MTSAAFGSDALTITLQPGAAAAMVTEYMPGGVGAQIINTGAKGTVYAGTSSTIQASNGVPIPPGSSVQWTAPGQLWLVLGSDATAPVTVAVSDRINNWASAEIIGSVNVAGDVSLSGPVDIGTVGSIVQSSAVLIEELIVGQTILHGGGEELSFDIKDYASVTVFLGRSGTDTPALVTITQIYDDGVAVETAFSDVFASPTNALLVAGPVQIPVVAATLMLSSNQPAGSGISIVITGSNRAPSQRPTVAGFSANGLSISTGPVACTKDVPVPLAAHTIQGQLFQGPAHLAVEIQATLTGYLCWQIAETTSKLRSSTPRNASPTPPARKRPKSSPQYRPTSPTSCSCPPSPPPAPSR